MSWFFCGNYRFKAEDTVFYDAQLKRPLWTPGHMHTTFCLTCDYHTNMKEIKLQEKDKCRWSSEST